MTEVLRILLDTLTEEVGIYTKSSPPSSTCIPPPKYVEMWCNKPLSHLKAVGVLEFVVTAKDATLVFSTSGTLAFPDRYAGGRVRVTQSVVELFVDDACIPYLGRLVQLMAVDWDRPIRYRPSTDLHNLTIMTWNIEGDANKGQHVVGTILSRQPDVVCLQEVTEDSWATIAPALQTIYPYVAGPVCFSNQSVDGTVEKLDNPFSIVILSLYPLHNIVAQDYLQKAVLCRGFLCADVDDWPLTIVCTHLDSSSQRAHYRQAQIQQLSSFVDKQTPRPWILAGDMNCAPSYIEYGAFKQNGWIDASIYLETDPLHGFTEDSVVNLRRRQVMANRTNGDIPRLVRFDQLHFRGPVKAVDVQTIRDPITLAKAPFFTFASDHFPVLGTFRLDPERK